MRELECLSQIRQGLGKKGDEDKYERRGDSEGTER